MSQILPPPPPTADPLFTKWVYTLWKRVLEALTAIPQQDHTLLSNLNTSNYYHLTAAEYTALMAGGSSGVTSFNGRAGVVVFLSSDLTGVGGVLTGDARLSDARPASDVYAWAKAATKPSYTAAEVGAAATSHAHGNLTSSGTIGVTADLPVKTTTGGAVTVGAWGTTAGTFCQGNDARLSDARPASDVFAWAKAATKPTYTAAEVGAADAAHTHNYAGSASPGGPATNVAGGAAGSIIYQSAPNVTTSLALGGANTVAGVNAAGTGLEYKALVAGTNIALTHAAGQVTVATAADVVTASGAATLSNKTFSGQTLFAAGTIPAPSIVFTGSTTTGFSTPAADTLAISCGGVAALQAQGTSITCSAGAAGESLVTLTPSSVVAGKGGELRVYGSNPAATALEFGNLTYTSGEFRLSSSGAYGTVVGATGSSLRLEGTGEVSIKADFSNMLAVTVSAIYCGAQLQLYPLGSVTAPDYSFITDTNTGMYRAGADQLGFVTGGVQHLLLNSDGALYHNGNAAYAPQHIVTNGQSDNTSGVLVARKNRAGGNVENGDALYRILGQAFQNSAYQNTAEVGIYVDGIPSGSLVPTRISLTTTNTSGTGGTLQVQSSGRLRLSGTGVTNNYYQDSDNTNNLTGQTLLLQDTGGSVGNGGQVTFGASQGVFAGIKGSLQNGTGPAGDLLFMTRNTSGNVVENMKLNSLGQLAIGTYTPNSLAKVTVAGTLYSGMIATNTYGIFGWNLTYESGFKYLTTGAGWVANMDGSNNLNFSYAPSGTAGAAVSSLTPILGLQPSNVVSLPQGKLAFPATQSASTNANTLDDYEEMSGTLDFSSWTTAPTTQSYVATKIGRLVTLTIIGQGGQCAVGSNIAGLPYQPLSSGSGLAMVFNTSSKTVAGGGAVNNAGGNKIDYLSALNFTGGLWWVCSVTYHASA